MRNILMVGIGGSIGAVLRYLIGGWVQKFSNNPSFPYGTLSVNLVGCFLIGLLGGLAESHELFYPEIRLLLIVGILGGFTTFSTFGYDTFLLLRDQRMMSAFTNVSLHVIVGLIAACSGYTISNLI